MVASPSGSLAIDDRTPVQGDPITFTCRTSHSQVAKLNWVGLYSDPGNGPVDQTYVGPATIWQNTPLLAGTSTFSTSDLDPGDYIAFYLHDDGYTWLADPVTFVVGKADPVAPPTYRGAFGEPGSRPGQLAMPEGVSVGPDGTIWVADSGNDRVQGFTASGKPARMIGEGALSSPADVVVDADGDLLVADSGHQRVARFTAGGDFVREYGKPALDNPRGVTVDTAGQVYASDTVHGRVLVFDGATGALNQTIKGKMSSPQGVTLDASGNLWVTQNSAYSAYAAGIVCYAPNGTVVTRVGGNVSSGFGGLSNPAYVVVDSTTLYVTIGDFGWTSMFATNGRFLGTFGSQHPATMRFPSGIALRGKDLYIADGWRSQVLHYLVGA